MNATQLFSGNTAGAVETTPHHIGGGKRALLWVNNNTSAAINLAVLVSKEGSAGNYHSKIDALTGEAETINFPTGRSVQFMSNVAPEHDYKFAFTNEDSVSPTIIEIETF